jgi:Flp pilus assembly protein TadB
VSARSPHSARTGAHPPERTDGLAPFSDHTLSDGWTPVEYTHSARRGGSSPLGRPGSVRRRRAAAARARRRRLLAIDLALGCVLALVVLVLASGLAIVALLALAGLLACGVSLALGRVRQRRSARKS